MRTISEDSPPSSLRTSGIFSLFCFASPSPSFVPTLLFRSRRAAFKDLTEEELQYLGGSETTTHLVKGLDYKLLEKVRQEQAKAENEALEAALNEQVEGPAKMELAAAAAGADPSKEASKTLQK